MQILNCSIFGNFKYLFEQFKIKIELTPNFKGPKVQFILITNQMTNLGDLPWNWL